MKKRRFFSSIFYSMTFSNTLIVLLIALVILFASVNFSRRVIYSEISKFNERMLQGASEKIEVNVFDAAQSAYLDLTLPPNKINVFDETGAANGSLAILNVHDALKSLVIKYPALDRLHVYYRRENKMISSNYGYKEFGTRSFTGDYAWMPQILFQDQDGVNYFSETRPSPAGPQNYVTFTFSYPLGVPKERATCSVVAMVEENKIGSLINDFLTTDYNDSYVINADGLILSALDPELVFTKARTDVLERIDYAGAYGIHDFRQDGVDYSFSHHKISETGWYLINTISIQQFYEPFFTMRLYIFSLAALVVLAGVNAVYFSSLYFYSPIKNLTRKAAESFGTEVRERRDEILIIGNALDNMHLRIDNLQDLLRANATVLKQNFLKYLLEDKFRPEEDIAERLRIFELPEDYAAARCFLADFNSVSMQSLPLKERQVIQLGIVERLNAEGADKSWFCIAGGDSEAKAAGIICYRGGEGNDGGKALEHIKSVCGDAALNLSIGGEVPGLSEIRQSMAQAEQTEKYRFFIIGRNSICWDDLAPRHESKETLPARFMNAFDSCTETTPAPTLTGWINEALDELKNGNYNESYARETIAELLHKVAVLTEWRLPSKEKGGERLSSLYKGFNDIDTIDYLNYWLNDYVKSVYSQKEPSVSAGTIDQVKKYISENLPGDLSLEAVAAHVYISPKYLSRIFKDTTGKNLSDHITGRRIDEAARLLMETRLTVDEIAVKVGYNSAAYFIKRFKEQRGQTPKQFRRNSTE